MFHYLPCACFTFLLDSQGFCSQVFTDFLLCYHSRAWEFDATIETGRIFVRASISSPNFGAELVLKTAQKRSP